MKVLGFPQERWNVGRPVSRGRERNESFLMGLCVEVVDGAGGGARLGRHGSVAQAPRQGRARGQVRNQGGSLEKSPPEAADPLAKVAALPARPHRGRFITRCGSARLTERHWLPRTIRQNSAPPPPW